MTSPRPCALCSTEPLEGTIPEGDWTVYACWDKNCKMGLVDALPLKDWNALNAGISGRRDKARPLRQGIRFWRRERRSPEGGKE